MKVIRRITYDWRGNPIEVKDYETTPCEYNGEKGMFVRPADEPQGVVDEKPSPVKDNVKAKEFIRNCEDTLAKAREFQMRIMKIGG